MINKDVESILFSEEDVKAKVCELGQKITADFKGRSPIFIGILKGSFIFMADLVRAVDLDCNLEFMAVSSYGSGTTTTGAVKITQDISSSIEGRDVIIVEDILDSGVTLSYLKKYMASMKPASISICTLLDKPARRRADIHADYVGFEVPDEFIVGYGLDYAQRYRNLPYIGVLKPSVYA